MEQNTQVNQKDNHPKKKKGGSNGKKMLLHVLSQLCLYTAVFSLLVVLTGTIVWDNGDSSKKPYTITAEDVQGQSYEDSIFFNEILGNYASDVLRFGVVSSQMETNGAFDGKKEIDVTAYVNRYNGIPGEYITAKYYLEDLIKWSQYGFERNHVYMSGKDADDFLSKMRTVTSIDYSSGNYTGGKISLYNSDLESITRVEDVSGNVWDSSTQIRDNVEVDILTNQYLSVDGKKIENYVFTWEEYKELCNNIESAATDLNANYETYMEMQEDFDYSNTNIIYCIKKTIGNKTQYYSNVALSSEKNSEITKFFKENYGKYIAFDPANMSYNTNTLIQEETLRHMLKNYSYAYPDNVQVWIGVDTLYPASDLFAQGNQTYSNFVPYYWQLLALSALCIIAYVVLLVVLSGLTGRQKQEDGSSIIRLGKIDKIPTEIWIAAVGIFVAALKYAYHIFSNISWYQFTNQLFIPLCMAGVIIYSVIFSILYFSMVRRIKGRNLWKDSLIRWSVRWLKTMMNYFYDHAAVLLRVWIPFAVYLVISILILVVNNDSMSRTNFLLFLLFQLGIGCVLYFTVKARNDIINGIKKIKNGDLDHKINEKNLHGDNFVLAQAVNSIGDGIREAVAASMKDERMKTDLITNVSHDIKTPLTSIINYVELIKRENIDNEKIKEYIEVLDSKSQRLKQLTDDLVEASKISSGNLKLHFEKINLVELVNQTIGEFSEKFEQKGLTPVLGMNKNSMLIEADSRRIWRVIENLFNNICKYALVGTRIYIDMKETVSESGQKQVVFSMKNISAQPLNIDASELTERFIRGDVARVTEGSGLGLSIAKSLTEAQKGKFDIVLDGDLFKVILTFPLLENS